MVGGAGVVVSLLALRGKTAHGGGYGSRSPQVMDNCFRVAKRVARDIDECLLDVTVA